MKRILRILLPVVVVGLASACTVNVERNDDGSLTATVIMAEEDLEEEIELALGDKNTQLRDVTVDLKDGYAQVTLERERVEGDEVDEIAFRMDLGVEDGHLDVTISEVLVNGEPRSGDQVDKWSERIANRLEKLGSKGKRRTLESVTVDEDSLTMVWRIETRHSQPDE